MFQCMDTSSTIRKNLSAELKRQAVKSLDITRATSLSSRQVKQILCPKENSSKINLSHAVEMFDFLGVSVDEMLGRNTSRTKKVATIKKEIHDYRDVRKKRDEDLSAKADILFKLINDLH